MKGISVLQSANQFFTDTNSFTPSINLVLHKGLKCINGHMNSSFLESSPEI